MKTEKIILSFIAIVVGLLAAGVAFYFYQMTKTVPSSKSQPITIKTNATPTPDSANLLTVDSPKDEAVFDKKTLTISGKTATDATIIVSSESDDQVVKPSANGDYTLTDTLPDGTSTIQITAIFTNGQQKTITRTVTYSTESF